ncbi:MAG: hypothetical protein PWR01_4154 [Clostridiales bacterium]|jgi:hypothetical protein|nr:hypothetical protein [Clostridiales bacterium]MDN5283081.1 hypothetical protein [Candidatus Ozemobacter sp.]
MNCRNRALTLVEISLALTILILAIIPLLRFTSDDAVTAIETEKIQIAERILESIKSELMALPFKRFYERSEIDGADKNLAGPFELSDGFYPISLGKVLEIQQKYKDFKVEGTWSYIMRDGKVDKTMVQADIVCSFSRARADEIKRNKSFLIVKP